MKDITGGEILDVIKRATARLENSDFNEVEEDIKVIEESNIWEGLYKCIPFEIKCRPFFSPLEDQEAWTYYIYLCVDYIPEKYDPESFWMRIGDQSRYADHPILSELDWHYEITYYRRVNDFDGEKRIIKVGCDYLHWDDKKHYDIDHIKKDVKRTIESFLFLVPEYGKKEDKE